MHFSPPLHLMSALEIREAFLTKKISAEEITRYFLERMEKKDPEIQSFLEFFNEKALEKARRLDQKLKNNEPLGSLAGIPIAIKDNMHIKGEKTTCGSKILYNFVAPFNATVSDLMEKEDAIFIGKTNLDEFAMGSSTENSAFKKTHNPWDLNLTPGGSSGGSAAAVAARLCPLSLGSDTGGSIRQPAAFCGVVGFKPTYGRVSRFGLVAYGSSFDQIGPFGNSVADVALLMDVIGKHCEKDSTSLESPSSPILPDLKLDFLKGLKIGVAFSFLEGLNEDARKNFEDSLALCKSQGAEIIPIELPKLKYSLAIYYILATAEASTNLARFDGIRYGLRSKKATNLEEVYTFSKEEGFGKEVKRRILLGTYVLSAGYQDAYYKKAQKVRTLMIEDFKKAFEKVSIIAMPVTPTPAFKTGAFQNPIDMYLQDIYTIAVNLAGIPAISVPSGFSKEGLPLGLQLLGPVKEDKQVLQTAFAFEKALNKSFIPAFA